MNSPSDCASLITAKPRQFLHRYIAVFFLLAPFALPQSKALAASPDNQWEINADRLTRYENPASVIAEGSVVLEERNTEGKAAGPEAMVIKGEWMVYDVDNGSVKGRGRIHVSTGGDEIFAEEGVVDLNKKTGTFRKAILLQKKKDVHLEGETIEKTGDRTYHLENGWVVTCRVEEGQSAPWSIWSSDAKLTRGGYATLRNASFRIKDVPVLYSPYMVVPIKNERQSGLLFPMISQSDRSGFGFVQPYYWDISPSADMTFYPGHLALRGATLGVEGRYALGPESRGMFAATYLADTLEDKAGDEFKNDGILRTEDSRYWIRGKANQKIGSDVELRLDLDIVSDSDYLQEFKKGVIGFDESRIFFQKFLGRGFDEDTIDQRRNTLQAKKSWSGMSLMGELVGINDVRPNRTHPSPVWSAPHLLYSGLLPLGESRVDLSWDADYVNYWRRQGTGYHRLDLYPKVSRALPIGPYFEGRASMGLRQTQWQNEEYGEADWSGSERKDRFIYDVNANIATTWQRDFNVNFASWNRIRHRFRPEATYRYVPEVNQDGIQTIDSIDSLAKENKVTYGVANYFNVYGSEEGKTFARDIGYFKLSQEYNIVEARRETSGDDKNRPSSDVFFELWLSPTAQTRLEYNTHYNVYGNGVTDYYLTGWYRHPAGYTLETDYIYKQYENVHDLNLHLRAPIWQKLSGGYAAKRSLAQDRIVEESVELVYHPECWKMILAASKTPDDQNIMLTFHLANIGGPMGFLLPGF